MIEARIAQLVDRAFDYRGYVTLRRSDGSVVVGFVYDRGASHLELLDQSATRRMRVPLAEIADIAFTGEDAARKSQEIWERRQGTLESSETPAHGDWGEAGPVNHADHRAVGLAVLDACRDAANGWVFPDAGPRCETIKDAYVMATGSPTHFVDVTATIDDGIASLREHRAYLDGLGRDFDPDEFLRNMAGYVGLGAGVEYAVGVRRYPMG